MTAARTSWLRGGEVRLELELHSPEQVETLLTALAPETESAPSDRSKVRLRSEGRTLIIHITAEDLVALRAATNSYLSWVSACQRAMDAVTGQKP